MTQRAKGLSMAAHMHYQSVIGKASSGLFIGFAHTARLW